jgi:hypothetical protein
MCTTYSCTRCKKPVDLDIMDKNQKDYYFMYGFCYVCQCDVDEENS